jgi:palmitoyl-protein thioesterase
MYQKFLIFCFTLLSTVNTSYCCNKEKLIKDKHIRLITIIEELSVFDHIFPIVLLHGITSDHTELTPVENWLKENLPNRVYNLEIGNGKSDSIFKTMDWQLAQLCNTIYSIDDLKDGFHFIGLSQGGLLARGYVEKCNIYPVMNLITWVTPHAGVYGFGDVDGMDINFNKIYTPLYQSIYSFAGYWKDPYIYDTYLKEASYLPNLNNERQNFIQYSNYFEFRNNIDNMKSLKNFVMIWSPNDDVLNPPQSGKFGFYSIQNNATNTSSNTNTILPIIDLFDTVQYKEDWLGLRTLNESERLHILETNCTHRGHKTIECFPQLESLTFQFLM